jgi:hypothetical protein
MPMNRLAVQYLEDSPGLAAISPGDARARLRAAFDRLPISDVLLGWNVPQALVAACREETVRRGAQLFRWHPLLTGDGSFVPRPEFQTVGLGGEPVPGFRDMLEFTFVCPNRPTVREAVLDHLYEQIRQDDYYGVFLDRIRYPSPVADPGRWLACFCDDCHQAAADEGIDLEVSQRHIKALLSRPERVCDFLEALLGSPGAEVVADDADLAALEAFLVFRARSVTRFVQAAAELIHAEGLAVGLDCFSPAVTFLVAQDLKALAPHCEWIKIMSYGHTLGPAGLPFELLGLADWLVEQRSVSESDALGWLAVATDLSLPRDRDALRQEGLAPQALAAEVRRGRAAGVGTLLAGIELVEVEGVTSLNHRQIAADLDAFRAAGADGLVLSWDLWFIPIERLELVRMVYLDGQTDDAGREQG